MSTELTILVVMSIDDEEFRRFLVHAELPKQVKHPVEGLVSQFFLLFSLDIIEIVLMLHSMSLTLMVIWLSHGGGCVIAIAPICKTKTFLHVSTPIFKGLALCPLYYGRLLS